MKRLFVSLSCMPCLGCASYKTAGALCTLESSTYGFDVALWVYICTISVLWGPLRPDKEQKSLILEKRKQKVTETLSYCKVMHLSVTQIHLQWSFIFVIFPQSPGASHPPPHKKHQCLFLWPSIEHLNDNHSSVSLHAFTA